MNWKNHNNGVLSSFQGNIFWDLPSLQTRNAAVPAYVQKKMRLFFGMFPVVIKLVCCAVMLRWYFPCRLQDVSFHDGPRWLMGSVYWPITTQLHTFAPKCVLARHRFHSDVFVVFHNILLLEALKQAESYVHKTGKIFLCTCIFLELCVDCKRFKYQLQFGGFDLEQNGPCVFGGKLFDVQQNYIHMIMHFLWSFMVLCFYFSLNCFISHRMCTNETVLSPSTWGEINLVQIEIAKIK